MFARTATSLWGLIAIALCCLWRAEPAWCQQTVWSVGRATNDRDVDLVNALVQRERFDDALAICRMLSHGADPQGDQAAKWAVERSQVLVARQMAQERFGEAEILAAAKPVRDLLNAYPQHHRRLFLSAQQLSVQRSAALHLVLRAAIAPADGRLRDQATVDLLKVTDALQSLIQDVRDTRVVLDQASENRPLGLIEDLVRLEQQLQVEAVSLALMQTELCKPGSDDCIAAATRAERIAEEAIATLPEDTQARSEVERLKIESIIRAGQYTRAEQAIQSLPAGKDRLAAPQWRALQVRLDLAQQRFQQAASRLDDFYGQKPDTAPRSIEMDLARLEFLLRHQPNQKVGDWLEAIQKRGGDYARRRAEALALSLLGPGDRSATPTIDPSIVAAQGQQYLRSGELRRGAELLAAAAEAEVDGGRAIRRALEAAAAFGSVKQYEQASDVLSQTALAHASAAQAAAVHLQAAFLVASHQPQAIERLESMLRQNLEQWPAAKTAPSARAWLTQLLTEQRRFLEAAEVTTDVPLEQWTPELVASLAASWQTVFRQSDQDPMEISTRFLNAYEPLLSHPLAAANYPKLAALLVDRRRLSSVSIPSDVGQQHPFAMALLAYRRNGAESPALDSPPNDWTADAVERLIRDGRQNPSLRSQIARLLERWPAAEQPSLDRAERRLWLGQIGPAVKLLEEWIGAEANSAERIKRAARLLGTVDRPEADREAVRLWDQLAAGAAQGSELWHEAKLAGIAAQRRAGALEDSQRRARYILLTMPNLDPVRRSQYERLSK